MKKAILACLGVAAVAFVSALRADVVLLIHGYLSGAESWDASGITTALERVGWQRAGVFAAGPSGIHLIPAPGRPAPHKVYVVDLPSEAPILIQAYQLRQILQAVNTSNPGEPMVLVGHSAGGVVARAALVRGGAKDVKALITIASPHLGTYRAEQALDVTDIPFPFSMVTDFFGGETYDTARRSRGLYVDLVRPRPGSLLFWLNNQEHPELQYFSIVRGETTIMSGDYIVPGYSQDMNNVPALSGRSTRIALGTQHGLEMIDGSVIVSLLAGMN
jgi:pimeloyl-ACP methyl ester carboxylesterase